MDELTRLANAAQSGRRDALERFVRAGYADVWRMCAALVDEQAAEDLTQESCLRATLALRRFRGDASARTWLLAIARRVCMDELRARERRRRRDGHLDVALEGLPASADPAGDVAAHDLLSRLEADRRAAFLLTQIFRLRYEDAAKICECPTGTIRSRVARAREDLIAALDAPSLAPAQRPTRAHLGTSEPQ